MVDLWSAGQELCERLIKEGVVVAPPITWNGECGSEEKLAMEMAGFLYSMYRVEFWYWEIFEILRKLFISAVLVHISDPDIRLGIGFAVSFSALLITFSARPFASAKLNNLMLSGHSIQTMTLAYGLLLGIQAKADSNSAVSGSEMRILEFIIALLNIMLIVIPYVFGLLDVGVSKLKSLFVKRNRSAEYTYIGPEWEIHLQQEDQQVDANLIVMDKEGLWREINENEGYYLVAESPEDDRCASAELVFLDDLQVVAT